MGTDPTDPDFEAGGVCAGFESFWGLGATPKYIAGYIDGLVKCPLGLEDMPGGSRIMTQDMPIGPCRWIYDAQDNTFHWALHWLPQPVFEVRAGDQIGVLCFQGIGQADQWGNVLVCSGVGPEPAFHDGKGWIAWGPGISP